MTKRYTDKNKLITAAPELLNEHITDLHFLYDIATNPFLSLWQKHAVQAMIHDKKKVIVKASGIIPKKLKI